MKQLIIGKSVAYTDKSYDKINEVASGAIGVYDLTTKELLTAKPEHNFTVVCGRNDGRPITFPEVDVKSLSVTKATYSTGAKFKATITVPTPVKGEEYTVMVVKAGTQFNERNTWSFSTLAKDTNATNVAAQLEKAINANKDNLEVKATHSNGTLTLEAYKVGAKYNVLGADGLMGVAVTVVTEAKDNILDKEYVQDLASRCAAGKGFTDTYADGISIYPGYPEEVQNAYYDMWTLRFAVPRVSAKQRDEVVYQTLHIVVPVGSAQASKLDTIFGVTAAPASANVLAD